MMLTIIFLHALTPLESWQKNVWKSCMLTMINHTKGIESKRDSSCDGKCARPTMCSIIVHVNSIRRFFMYNHTHKPTTLLNHENWNIYGLGLIVLFAFCARSHREEECLWHIFMWKQQPKKNSRKIIKVLSMTSTHLHNHGWRALISY